MADRSVIIIGAGLAGLATGCYAQMNGYRSRIFEHSSGPGGVAAAWQRHGYLVDGGIHFLMGHRPGQATYDLYRELGATQEARVKDMTRYCRFVDETLGHHLDVTGDLHRLALDLKSLARKDVASIDRLLAGATAIRGTPFFELSGNPPELGTPLQFARQAWKLRRVLKYFGGDYNRPVADYARRFRSPLLRQILGDLFLPEVPVWFVLGLLALLADGQMGLLLDGCRGFVLPIERRYKELGGEIVYSATVEEILTRNGHAAGVRLGDATEHSADIVVSAADGHATIFTMLGGRYVDRRTVERYRSWPLIRPAVIVSYGIAGELPDEPPLSVINLKNPVVIGDQLVPGFSLRIFNYSGSFAPAGKTLVQAMLETNWDFWSRAANDPADYKQEKERLAGEVLDRLESHYPGITARVEMVDVATPHTTWRYTLNHRGAYMAWLATPETLRTSIRRTLPGLNDFYMAGQWVVPGGGVPSCLYSGRQAVEIMCRRDGKPFVTGIP